MSVNKIIIAGTLLLVSSVLYVSVVQPDNLLFSFASLSPDYTEIRLAIGVLLFGLLISSPPRSILFRNIIGAASLVLVVMTGYYFFSYGISVIDAVVFMQVAIVFGIEALEPRGATTTEMQQLPRRRMVLAQ